MSNFLTDRFEEALIYAARLHAEQKRKRSSVPYFAHLLGVTSLVLEDGGEEDEAIAALLHDAVEDQGGVETLMDIRLKFGSEVADIVDALTDSYTDPKPPWRERKEAFIASIRTASPAVIRVSLADKVYNARATLWDIRREGEAGWDRFNGGKEGTLWYYRQLVREFAFHGPRNLLSELTRIVEELERISAD
ncbi:MAG: bifunctional (p)ppGpp synthetase/guanosine-3',5'-bis(diphosphate) 3'-pyrophosphohydrolase [Chloroflexota bacterium]|nr:MAG: bifunctional (p)ppGpp synthetase/guanosine-3',5'-bis(diphosphate) 3'-pyrophosphohydrolase [Chloroflexota bacterium]